MQSPLRVLELLSLKPFTAFEIQIGLQLNDNDFDKAIYKLIGLEYTSEKDGAYFITSSGKSCLSSSNCLEIIWGKS